MVIVFGVRVFGLRVFGLGFWRYFFGVWVLELTF